MITREEAIAMAKEAGITVYEGAQDRAIFDGSIIDALLSLACLAHNRGLEDAAKVCDRFGDRGMHPHECRDAIRKLKGKQ